MLAFNKKDQCDLLQPPANSWENFMKQTTKRSSNSCQGATNPFAKKKKLKNQKNTSERYHVEGDSIQLPNAQIACNVRGRQRREHRTRGERERKKRKRIAAATAAFKRLHCARLCSSRMDGWTGWRWMKSVATIATRVAWRMDSDWTRNTFLLSFGYFANHGG